MFERRIRLALPIKAGEGLLFTRNLDISEDGKIFMAIDNETAVLIEPKDIVTATCNGEGWTADGAVVRFRKSTFDNPVKVHFSRKFLFDKPDTYESLMDIAQKQYSSEDLIVPYEE